MAITQLISHPTVIWRCQMLHAHSRAKCDSLRNGYINPSFDRCIQHGDMAFSVVREEHTHHLRKRFTLQWSMRLNGPS